MQRHDQMVDRAGARHVQQPPSLRIAHLFIDRLVGDEHPVVAAPGEHPAVVGPHDAVGDGSARLGREARHDRDRELETLRGVDGHHPHGVVVVLGQDRVGDAALRCLQRCPLQVAPNAVAAGVGPCSGLLDHEPQATPDVAGVDAGERQIEQAAFVGHRGEQVGRRHRADAFSHRSDVCDRVGHRMPGEFRGWVGPQIPGAAARLPLPQFDVAAAVHRAAQCLDQGECVGRIVGCTQDQEQLADLGGGVHH